MKINWYGYIWYIYCYINWSMIGTNGIKDWLINDIWSYPNVSLKEGEWNGLPTIELNNGLISRKFLISPNFATIEYNNYLQIPSLSAIRSITAEGRIRISGQMFEIGGIVFKSNITQSFLNLSWINIDNVESNDSYSFQYITHRVSTELFKPYEWTPGTRYSPKNIPWPPLGLALEVTFAPPVNSSLNSNIQQNIRVIVRYEMLQGMPILTKMMKVVSLNPTDTEDVWISYMEPEILCVNPPFSSGNWGGYATGLLYLTTDIAHGSEIQWYTQAGQSNSPGSTQPCVHAFYTPMSEQWIWSVRLAPDLPGTLNGVLESFRVLEVMVDSKSINDLERYGLSQRRMMKYLTPCIMENPIYTQVTNVSEKIVYNMIDQCNETGFELMAFSFGTQFNMENTSADTMAYYDTIIKYATAKNVIVGGYDLIDMARNVTEYIRIDTNPNVHDTGECYASGWSDIILGYFEDYISIGLKMIITDGPYPGFSCAALETHKYHDNLNDSVFRQQYLQNQFYIQMKSQDIFVHTPDNYYYVGGNRNKYPYTEHTFTLPLWEDMTIARQLMFDTSYYLPPTSGWMFMPMIPYEGGPPDSTFEPLSENIQDYDWALGMYFSYAVAPTIRGYELFDNENTKQVVIKWVNFFKKHRDILISDIIHIRRPDNQFIDSIMHVNPDLSEKGLVVFFNPIDSFINTTFQFSLYYTGLSNNAYISHEDQPYRFVALDRIYFLTLSVSMQPRSITYYLISDSP